MRAFTALLGLVLAVAAGACVPIERPPQEPSFEEDVGAAEPGEELEVPLEIHEGPGGGVLAFVPVFIDDEGPFPFALDTGASHSIVDDNIAEELGLEETGETMPVSGIIGGGRVRPVEIPQWRVGGVDLPAGSVGVIDLGEPGDRVVAGLLGSDVLSAFGAITLDYDQQRLLLRPQR